jgi:hypothetical protein
MATPHTAATMSILLIRTRTLLLVLVLLTAVVQCSDNNEYELGCSRKLSRSVRKVVNEHVEPRWEELGVSLPEDCPLLSVHDVYAAQEQQKDTKNTGTFKCKLCARSFKDEDALDQHMHRRHDSLMNDVCYSLPLPLSLSGLVFPFLIMVGLTHPSPLTECEYLSG